MDIRLSRTAIADIANLLVWSEENFGEVAEGRYRSLVDRAIRDVAEDPRRALSAERPELGAAVRTWHLRHSRGRVPGDSVRAPRHFLVYRVEDDLVVIGRVLHERMDLARHIEAQQDFD